jgi:hypothetical protein
LRGNYFFYTMELPLKYFCGGVCFFRTPNEERGNMLELNFGGLNIYETKSYQNNLDDRIFLCRGKHGADAGRPAVRIIFYSTVDLLLKYFRSEPLLF